MLQVVLELVKKMQLLSRTQQRDNVSRSADSQNLDETLVVEVDESSHDELAIHAVTHSSMPRDGVPEILQNNTRTFILTERLSPEAKNPPKGPIVLAKREKTMKWACSLVMLNGPTLRS